MANKERGISRIESLLDYFGLMNRIVNNASEALNLSDIDYDAVYEKLENTRVESMVFLKNAL